MSFGNQYEKYFDKIGVSDYIRGLSTQLNNIPKIINLNKYHYKLPGAIKLKTSKNLHIKIMYIVHICINNFILITSYKLSVFNFYIIFLYMSNFILRTYV